MPRYSVTARYTYSETHEVEADNADDARLAVEDMVYEEIIKDMDDAVELDIDVVPMDEA